MSSWVIRSIFLATSAASALASDFDGIAANGLQNIHDSSCRTPSFVLSVSYAKYANRGCPDAWTPPPSSSPAAGPWGIVDRISANAQPCYYVPRRLSFPMVGMNTGSELWFKVYKISETELVKLESGRQINMGLRDDSTSDLIARYSSSN
ncbi:hypothetical protein BDQ94DRAFT_164171 [Aspergillus welwitschiae]|uniref:Uncharacterized protein n=1 Tax=Aspergillus welwitschiae TaxID=1341132 RepID=A0A3F3PIP3_9EURO|nr:hypothetical protein BDQ94DRAFT_164171 [Aspergillus welwitschiae]RDH26820.1 hypothetical protein BDQ94DRAFT_164171 [Aspergillus welwitschiae]